MAKKCKILLVDDEKDIVNVLKKGLEQNGFEVDAFTDPREALSAFKAGVHDLLIFDIRMPGMTGIQLYKEIKDIDENVRVLFLTAFEIQEKEWHLVLPHTEATGFIKKPVTIQYLVNAIKRAKTQATH
jgi:DNA-binding NtrC family response regulator